MPGALPLFRKLTGRLGARERARRGVPPYFVRMTPTTASLFDELRWRGLLYQHTQLAEAALAAGPVVAYCGFDPTAASLHVGNLVPVMALVHLQHTGHRPIALVGGGTGMIGDPGGRTSERPLLEVATIDANVAGIRGQLERFLDFDGPRGATLVNNAEWLRPLHAVDFMRDVGKHFTVNWMMAKDSVKSRLEDGISYTEFSYMLLQAYDFLELYRRQKVTFQIGGSDQWGNMIAGVELVRRAADADAHVVTLPLVTNASGAKFGKSEAGAVWLDPALTSPYQFYQFWLNTDDRDAAMYVKYFTLLDVAAVAELERAVADAPAARAAQSALARDVTRRVHGESALIAAEQVSGFLFGALEPAALADDAFALLAREAPFAEVRAADISEADASGAPIAGGRLDAYKLLTASGIAASNGAAKRLLEQGGVSVNKRKLAASERYIAADGTLLRGGHIVVGKGKRDVAVLRVRG